MRRRTALLVFAAALISAPAAGAGTPAVKYVVRFDTTARTAGVEATFASSEGD